MVIISILLQTVKGGYINIVIPTDEQRLDPNYVDPCSVDNNGPCSYCCIISTGSCSRDIRACNPVYKKEFWNLRLILFFVLGPTMGFALLRLIIKLLVQ